MSDFLFIFLNIWLNAYENLKIKENKNRIFNFYNLLKMKFFKSKTYFNE